MKKVTLFAILPLVFCGIGCSDSLNEKSDPNNPSKIDENLIFSNLVSGIGSTTDGGYNLIGGFWSQYWTHSNGSNQFWYIDKYGVSATDFNGEWKNMYEGLDGLQKILDSYAKSNNWSMYLMATVVQCYGLQVLADLYDQIPLNSALFKNPTLSSKFVKGEVVYDSLIVKLNRALSKSLTPLSNDEIKSDLIFSGNMTKWRQFANTLKLKIYMRQMYARPQVAQSGITAMFSVGETFLSEDAHLDFFTKYYNSWNPFYAAFYAKYSTINLMASATLFLFLQNKNDSRLSYLFDKAYNGTSGQPLPQGGFNVIPYGEVPSTSLSPFKIVSEAPVYFISKAESYFLQAEAIAKGWGIGNEKLMYDNGVKAAFGQIGLDGASYTAQGAVYEYPSNGDFEVKQKSIIMQKWISMAGSNGIEAFFELNRTHYPAISEIPAYSNVTQNRINPQYKGGELTYSLAGITSGLFPKRLLFPQIERDCNPDTPDQVELTKKVWWDKK